MPYRSLFIAAGFALAGLLHFGINMSHAAEPQSVSLKVENTPKAISPDLFGIFFEDLNFAADGGLYAELIENRSFDFSPLERSNWNALTGWETIRRGGRGDVNIDAAIAIHPNNPTYAVLEVHDPGDGVGLANDGFGGIAVKEGETYNASLFARQLFIGHRWGGKPSDDPAITHPKEGKPGPIILRLESKDGTVLAETSIGLPGVEWQKLTATLKPSRSDPEARFVLLVNMRCGLALDMISLFPAKTFKGRPNGLRADLAQTIADLKPRFIRFPGGCLVHGNGVGNMYRWKDTVGPVETRKGQPNLWRYHQSVGLGYFEYFQFCQDIGALPLPVVPAGVSCQNSAFTGGIGQRGIPMEQMPDYIQEVLDLVEYANGPADSKWGAVRAAAGHPEPFNLKYLGVGNEEHITPAFKERFQMIYEALKAKHPEITAVGTVGPAWRGEDYENGWRFTREHKHEMVDEHYYVEPDWFWNHLDFYDKYDRSSAKVYLGEYAAHDEGRKSTLRSALAEAAYMTSLERNGDIVHFASYAPLLGKHGNTQWTPDLIYFDNSSVSPTVNYFVQQLFAHHAGDEALPISLGNGIALTSPDGKALVTGSCVRDSKSGDVILKLVSRSSTPTNVQVDLTSILKDAAQATRIDLTGDALAENLFGQSPTVTPKETQLQFKPQDVITVPANALAIIRIAKSAK